MKQLYRLHAEMCKAFSSPTRLEILDILRMGAMSVTELTEKTGLGQANMSQHLSVLRNKGVLVAVRKGRNTYYMLANRKIIRAFDIIREVLAQRLAGPDAGSKKAGRS